MLVRSAAASAVAAAAAVATSFVVLAGCAASGATPPPTAPAPPSGSSVAAPAATPSGSAGASTGPSAGAGPTAAGGGPTAPAGSRQIKAADGTLVWTMPCAAPRDQKIEGDAQESTTYTGFHAWACDTAGNTTAGVIVAELATPPADDDAARQQLSAALARLAPGTPTGNEFQGHPGVTLSVTNTGATAAYQGVSFGPYLALFFTAPAEDLPRLTDRVVISG